MNIDNESVREQFKTYVDVHYIREMDRVGAFMTVGDYPVHCDNNNNNNNW